MEVCFLLDDLDEGISGSGGGLNLDFHCVRENLMGKKSAAVLTLTSDGNGNLCPLFLGLAKRDLREFQV